MAAAAAASSSSSPATSSVGGVEPVGEQREPQVALAVAEVVDLQAADLGLDVRVVGEEHRHDDERPQLGRHAVVEVEPRQRPRPEHVRHGRD